MPRSRGSSEGSRRVCSRASSQARAASRLTSPLPCAKGCAGRRMDPTRPKKAEERRDRGSGKRGEAAQTVRSTFVGAVDRERRADRGGTRETDGERWTKNAV